MFDDLHLKKRVQGHVRARIPREDADDVIQEAWLRIIANQDKYDPKRGSLWSWAKFHCKSAVGEYYRKRQPTFDAEDIDEAVESERSITDYELLLEVTFAAPSDLYQLIVFAYVQLLEWKPGQIVAEFANETLEDLGNRFVVEYASHFGSQEKAVHDLLRSFTERLRHRREPLSRFFCDPADARRCSVEVSRWRYGVQRRTRSDLLFLRSLEAHLRDGRPRAAQIAEGLVDFVGWRRETLNGRAGESLQRLAEEFQEGCCTERRRHLRGLIERLFRPLFGELPSDSDTQGKKP